MISVVMPAYNAAATIADALVSVVSQTFHDFEIIVVDDASVDGTSAIATKQLQVSGFKSQVKPPPQADPGSVAASGATETGVFQIIGVSVNSGPAAARNRGIAAARGEWIAFLDADDKWSPCRMEAQANLARQCPDVALWCGETLRLEALPPGGEHASPEAQESEPSKPFLRRFSLKDFALCNPIATSTVLVQKAVLQAVGGFNERFRGPEDYDLWIRIAAQFNIMKTSQPLAYYRHDVNSLSMDERSFLPQVLNVLDQAYGPQGVFYERRVRGRRQARAYQFLCAAWAASSRGRHGAALRLFGTSFRECPWLFRHPLIRPLGRTRLLAFIARNGLHRAYGGTKR